MVFKSRDKQRKQAKWVEGFPVDLFEPFSILYVDHFLGECRTLISVRVIHVMNVNRDAERTAHKVVGDRSGTEASDGDRMG